MLSPQVEPGLTTLEQRIGRICALIDEHQGEAIHVLDLRGISDFTDAFVIATVRNPTHMQALSKHLVERLRAGGLRPINRPDEGLGRWALLDYGDVIIHLFEREAREYYDLDNLWGDAQTVAWEKLAMA
ncbi:MAG TPA: ribosome silencing factor [Candidatus Sumerlaeota bacterium]|nr:MAG: Ribosomal silencing factor RsfS [candidate division BRC1 bacterium ADurb.BinA292]HOR28690.1 ribosome silencing factor [Candidatus Sumerlaeota bacterium]HPK03958.1 ribosome silencing factor [Candidatus Sumerlaeota bacterium]